MSLFLFCKSSFVSYFVDSTWKWYHMVFVFLGLTSINMTILDPPMLLQMALFHSCWWLSNISVCVCVCVCAHHILFIHSSVSGYLGCFYVLTIVNSAAVNTGVRISFWMIVLYGYVPRSGIARSYSGSIFNCLRTLHSDCTNVLIHSHQQCQGAGFFILQCLLFIDFLN